jgi:broad-specificity NMP kinase
MPLFQMTGLSGAGKTSIANLLKDRCNTKLIYVKCYVETLRKIDTKEFMNELVTRKLP